MKRVALLVFSTLISIAPLGALHAQQVGTYSGTSADGQTITMQVTETSGQFFFGNVNVHFEATCTHPAGTADEGWGFFLGQQIVSGSNDFHSGNDYYDITGSLHFPNNKTIKGTITSVTAVFVPGSSPPKAAHFCKSAKQAFTLTTTPAPVIAPVKPGTAVTYR